MNLKKKAFYFPLFLSVMIHILILCLYLPEVSVPDLKADKAFKIKYIKMTEKEMLRKKNQVVNNEFDGEEKESDDAKYLGKKNQTYEEETISKRVGQFKEGEKKEKEKSPSKSVAKQKKKKKKEEKKKIKLSDLAISPPKDDEEYLNNDEATSQKGPMITIGSGESRNNDFVEGVKPGEFTHLNTREFKYWGFFNRIRKSIEPAWERMLREKVLLYGRNGKRFIKRDNAMTLIRIVLDQEGNLVKITVLSSSGVEELDELATSALEKAAPFRGVPKGMLQDDHAILEWGFIVRL